MNSNNIMQTDLLDILFINKNKSYGAHQLRKSYNKRLLVSLLVMMGICLLSSAIFRWNALHQSAASSLFVTDDIILSEANTKQQPPVIPPPVKSTPQQPQQIATLRVTTIRLVNEQVAPPPTQDAMTNIKIDVATRDGIRGDIVAPPVEQSIGTEESLVKKEDYTKEFHTVEKMAQFPGGLAGWMNYLHRNLRSELPAENGAPVGNYTIKISFLVDREGNISEVKADNDPGFGTAAEAVRVVERGPKWQPAEQNGHAVIYRQTQTITFVVSEQN